MAKVLVVGGAGYVGGWLTDQAILAGHDVRVVDKLLYEDAYLKNVDFYYGDVLDPWSIENHLKWADTVIWLAALVGDPACALNPELTIDTNVGSIKRLVNSFGGQIIFPSTCSVYGAQHGELTESSPLNPLSLYAESKIEAEEVLKGASNQTVIFRLGTLFGLGDTYSRLRADLVLNVLTVRAVLEGHMTVFGGEQFRPLLHVRDVATAMVPEIGSSSVGIYNLHTENVTIVELANRIKQIVPTAELITSESSFQDSRNYMVSSEKAVTELGFSPKWSVDHGIREVAETVSQRRIPNVNLPRFSNVAALSLGAK